MDSDFFRFLKDLERQVKDATPGITHAVETFCNSPVITEVREMAEKAKETVPGALLRFAKAMDPYRRLTEKFVEHFDELRPYFEAVAQTSKVIQTIESLADHQYVVISPMHPDMVNSVVTDQMIEEYLESDEKVQGTIDFIKEHLDDPITFDQSEDAFWAGKYNLSILGFIATLDYFLSKCSDKIKETSFKKRVDVIRDKVNEKGDLYLDDLEAADFALSMTYYKAIIGLGNGGSFKMDEPPHLSRDWIMHGRSKKEYTRFDCVRILNMIYGTIRMHEIAEEDEKMKFYKIDDQVIISDKSLTIGAELIPNTTDAAGEKHVPVITVNGNEVKVTVGSVEHPSLEQHYIEWIVLVTETGFQMKWLKPGMKPEAVFMVTDKPVAAFEYCNLHGLWKAEI